MEKSKRIIFIVHFLSDPAPGSQERNPEVPASTRDEALFRCARPSGVPSLTNLALHERLPEILIVPREETYTAAAARGCKAQGLGYTAFSSCSMWAQWFWCMGLVAQ